MKRIYTLILMISFTSIIAQTADRGLDELVNAERKGAAKRMQLLTNPNTYNYDIVYHRLRLTVDPTVVFVSGEVTTKFIATENINSVTFDLSNDLVVSTVKQRGIDLPFTRSSNNELIINLPVTQNI
ncbi:MAG TPA: hypothetical protein VK476_02925, partial [Flavobacterium sp.]|nr:hypothetical protein [Flavobacterium sp.]